MPYDPEKHDRRSIRLPHYDYGQPGAYFITTCTQGRVCLFGDVVQGQTTLNAYGRIVAEEWHRTERIRDHVALDAFVVMPNHVHGIIGITHRSDRRRGESKFAPTRGFKSPSQTLGAIVRGFKGATTRRINRLRGTPGEPVWQRNYYEHTVRGRRDLERIRRYIRQNPVRWCRDRNHPRQI
jgi:REP element-mobilizing transposase RayT